MPNACTDTSGGAGQLHHLRDDAGVGKGKGGTRREPRTRRLGSSVLGGPNSNPAGLRAGDGGHIPGLGLHHLVAAHTSIWIQFALSTPVVLWAGWPFFERAWASVVNRSLNMFSLIALGTGVAYLYSLFATCVPGVFPSGFRGMGGTVPVYFEAAAVITVLVLLGQVLELRAREQTGGAIRAMLKLAPKTARRLSAGVEDEEVGIELIRVGDLLRVRPGDGVPVDGEVLEGKRRR